MQWIEVSSLDELRRQLNADVKILGGGTQLLQEGTDLSRVVDLSRLATEPSLYQTSDGRVHIGHQVTLQRLLDWELTPPDLKRVLRQMGAVPFRNLATVIGRLANFEEISDLYPIMRLYETRIVYVTPFASDPQERPLSWAKPPLPEAWLQVMVPARPEPYPLVEFKKYSKSSPSRTVLNVTAALSPITDTPFWMVRLIASGLGPTPVEWSWTERLPSLFSVVSGQLPDECQSLGADPFGCHLVRTYWEILHKRLESRL